jgi:hypothetical protein
MMPLLTLIVLVQFFAAARPFKIQIFGGGEKRKEGGKGLVNIVGRFRHAGPSMRRLCPRQWITAQIEAVRRGTGHPPSRAQAIGYLLPGP